MNIANCYHIVFKKFVSNIVVKSYQLDGISEIFIFKYNEKKNYRYIYHFSLRCKWFETRTNDQLEPRSRFPSRATRFPHFSFPLAYFHSKSSVHSRVKGRDFRSRCNWKTTESSTARKIWIVGEVSLRYFRGNWISFSLTLEEKLKLYN